MMEGTHRWSAAVERPGRVSSFEEVPVSIAFVRSSSAIKFNLKSGLRSGLRKPPEPIFCQVLSRAALLPETVPGSSSARSANFFFLLS